MADSQPFNLVDLGQLFAAPLRALIHADALAAREFATFIELYGFTKEPNPSARDANRAESGPGKIEAGKTKAGAGEAGVGGPGIGNAGKGYPGEDDPGDGDPDEDDRLGTLRMVSFRVPRPSPDGSSRWSVVKLPLLSLIPLPMLEIQDAEVRYGIRVVEVRKYRNDDDGDPPRLLRDGRRNEDTVPWLEWRAMLADRQLDSANRTEAAPQMNANIDARVRMRRADVPAGIATLLGLLGETTLVQELPSQPNPRRSDP